MIKTLRALKFLFVGPMILALLFVINWITSPGDWWVQWAALGIGIAWVISLFRVVFAIIVAGGLADSCAAAPAAEALRAPGLRGLRPSTFSMLSSTIAASVFSVGKTPSPVQATASKVGTPNLFIA